MYKIDLNSFPKIRQTDLIYGCIPVNIENILKYFGNNNFNEAKILKLFSNRQIESLSFPHIARDFAPFIPNFKIIFKSCQGSLKKLINYLKSNIQDNIPTILSVKAKVNPDLTHAVSIIGFNEEVFSYYDPGDGQEHIINYINDEFKNRVQAGDYHTLAFKRIFKKNF